MPSDALPSDPAPPGFRSLSLTILRTGPADPDEAAAGALTLAHLRYLKGQWEAGTCHTPGPCTDQDDPTIRGLCFWTVPLAEARRLAEADPAVEAGMFTVEALRWLTLEGVVDFSSTTPPFPPGV